MENSTTLALSKIIKDKNKDIRSSRKQLSPGEYDVDTTIRVKGTVKVGEDYERKATASLLNSEFFMLVLKNSGVTRESAVAAISLIASEYLSSWDGTQGCRDAAKKKREEMVESFDPDGSIRELFEGIKYQVPSIKCAGQVKFSGSVDELDVCNSSENVVSVSIKQSSVESVA